jgi:hypothetical protein
VLSYYVTLRPEFFTISYLRDLCLFADSGVQHILGYVFVFDCPSIFSNIYS